MLDESKNQNKILDVIATWSWNLGMANLKSRNYELSINKILYKPLILLKVPYTLLK